MIETITKNCSVDDKTLKHWASVKITVTNPRNTYQGSGRSFRYSWSLILCKRHLSLFIKTVERFLQ